MPEDYEMLKQQGEEALAKEDFDLALQCFEKALELAPEEAEAYSSLGKVFARLENFEKAEAFFEKALEIDPSCVLAIHNRSVLYLRQGNPQLALQLAHKALQASPDSAIVYNNLGNIYSNMGDFEKCEYHARKAVSLDESSIPFKYNLALLFYKQERWPEAEEVLRELLFIFNKSDTQTNLYINLKLDSLLKLVYVIFLNERTQQLLLEIIDLLNTAMEIAQKQDSPKEIISHIYYQFGRAYYYMADFENALQNFKQCSVVFPSEEASSLYVYMANTYIRLQQYSLAKDCYDKVLDCVGGIDNINIKEVYSLAYCYFSQEKVESTITLLESFLDRLPSEDSARASHLLGCAYFKLDNFEKSIQFFERYLTLSPGDVNAHRIVGDMYLHLGKVDEALNALMPALESNGLDPKICNLAIKIYTKKGDLGLVEIYKKRISELLSTGNVGESK